MARQRIHNSRTGTGAGNAGASWISYSDMMAALLLVFVLILSVSLYQYFTMLETTQAELESQRAQLEAQQIILLDQQNQLDDQTLQLAAQQVTMDHQNSMIIIIQGQLDAKQDELEERDAALQLSQQELANATLILQQREAELETNRIALNAAQTALDDQQRLFNERIGQLGSMVGVKAEIIREVRSSLAARNITASVDPNSGDIIIDSRMLTFESGKSDLTAQSRAFLNSFIPAYLDVLMRPEYSNYLGSIIIEGHTDHTGSYDVNMELSQQRALEVLLYIRGMYAGNPAMQARLDQILVATGKGYSDPIYYSGTQIEDQNASRRVEFKFELRDSEMIQEINRILSNP